jgi:hypothetical protein
MWGAGGPFLAAAAMVVAVVMPVVFCNKATENCNKNNKIHGLHSFCLCITTYCKTYCSSHDTNCSVAKPELCSVASPNHFSPMEPWHIGYCQKALVIARMISVLYQGQNVGIN